jgi:DNA modification methylase
VTGSALVLRADALHLPLPDASVDLIVSSPPYFALRSYRDGDEHYAGQLGSEPTPQAFLEALWAVMHECWRVLKPTGSCFVNLGDKRSGSGGHNNSGISGKSTLSGNGHVGGVGKAGPQKIKATLRNAPDRYNQAAFGRPKSKMLLPHRFAIGCEDGLADPEGKGWVMRSDLVWQKLNGLPESVTDRCRDSHEYLFHLTKSERYFAAVDEVREQSGVPRGSGKNSLAGQGTIRERGQSDPDEYNPLGKLPGSVWALPSEPLIISDEVKAHYDLPDHFAAFPTELVRRVILGWSPSGICTGCGEGRRPVVAKGRETVDYDLSERRALERVNATGGTISGGTKRSTLGHALEATITGYSCRCGIPAPATKPATVLDIFGGTGTTAGVARAVGRTGISVDLSHDYSRLADYLIHRSGRFAKVVNRTHRENQQSMFGVPA